MCQSSVKKSLRLLTYHYPEQFFSDCSIYIILICIFIIKHIQNVKLLSTGNRLCHKHKQTRALWTLFKYYCTSSPMFQKGTHLLELPGNIPTGLMTLDQSQEAVREEKRQLVSSQAFALVANSTIFGFKDNKSLFKFCCTQTVTVFTQFLFVLPLL